MDNKTQEDKQNPMRVELMTPIKTQDGVAKTITFRRGKTRDLLAAQRIEKEPERRELVLMSMLSEEKVTPEDLEELDLADMAQIQQVFQSLFVRPA